MLIFNYNFFFSYLISVNSIINGYYRKVTGYYLQRSSKLFIDILS